MPIDFRAAQIQGNKLIASGSTGTPTGAKLLIYPHEADDAISPNQGFIDQSVFNTGSIGTDIFLYVSGGIGKKNVGGSQAITVFGGDVHISGNLSIDGTGGGGGGGTTTNTGFYRMEVLDYAAINSTSSITVGQVIFPANQFTGSIVLHGVIANQLSTATGSIQLYNVTSGSYVEIGGVGITHIAVSGTVPTIVTSVNLISASNFNSSSQSIYELQVSSSNGASYAFFGGFELRPSGSFSGVSYVTSSVVYISGTWQDGGNKLATTASVSLAGDLGTGYFADNVGSDVYFFVSGNNGGVAAGDGVAVFGGDVVMSGTLFGGSPLKIGTKLYINGASNGDNNGNLIQFDNSGSGATIRVADNSVAGLSPGNLDMFIRAGSDFLNGGTTGGTTWIYGGDGADKVPGGAAGGGDVIVNAGNGGDGAAAFPGPKDGGNGGIILIQGGSGGTGVNVGGDGGSVIIGAGSGNIDISGSGDGGGGGSVSLAAGTGASATNTAGTGGTFQIVAGDGGDGFDGASGGTVSIYAGAGGDGFGGSAAVGGSIQIVAGSPGFDNIINAPTGSGPILIAGGLHSETFHYESGSNMSVGIPFGFGQTFNLTRIFFNRSADPDYAATNGLPLPTDNADVFFYVSGTSGGKNGSIPTIALFDGDVHISGNLTVDGTYPTGGGSGIVTLQQTYDAGVATIGVNDSTGSFVISGSLTPVGFNYPPLLRLEPGNGGPYGSNYSAIDVLAAAATSASLINIRGNSSNAGGAQILLRSTGDTNSKIGWLAGAGELYGSTPDADIEYHPNANAIKLRVGGSGKKVAVVDDSGQSGTGNVAEFINATGAYGGTVKFFTGANASNASVINSGSLEQVRDAKFYSGLSGSLTQLTDGSSYIVAGSGIGVSSASNGSITISTTGGSTIITGKQYIASATTTTTTTPLMIGQFSWVPSDYTGLTSVTIRAIMSTDGTANHTGSLQIYNLTSGSYLDLIDTPATSTCFDITSSIPTLITSSNLLNGITNFDNSSTSVYEVRVSGSTANNTIIGGVELIFS